MAVSPDPAAVWFGRLRELGEAVDLRVLHLETPTSEPRRWLLPHESFDGARMMQRVLREVRRADAQLPRLRDGRPPSFLRRVGAVWRTVAPPTRALVPWRSYDGQARGSNQTPLGYTLFEPDQTLAIAARARERGASMNSFLLWALDRSVHRDLAEPSPTHIWALAVNMRGAVGPLEHLDNVAVAVPIAFAADASPADVKRAIRSCLEADTHWGAWYALRVLAALGAARIRSQVTGFHQRDRHSSVGTFSSVGPYDVAEAGWIVFAPPALKTHPVAAGAVRIGGRLALALHVHPVLGPVDPQPLVNRWRALLEGAPADGS
jgi:hypothetical protein